MRHLTDKHLVNQCPICGYQTSDPSKHILGKYKVRDQIHEPLYIIFKSYRKRYLYNKVILDELPKTRKRKKIQVPDPILID